MRILLELFWTCLKIGAFTLGGGYAMVPLMEREVCGPPRRWFTPQEFLDLVVVSQCAPGPIAVNSVVFVGYRLKGYLGAVVATVGVVLPSFAIILAIAAFLVGFRANPFVEGAFQGIRPAVVALILATAFQLARSAKRNIAGLVVAAITLAAVLILDASPITVIVVAGVAGIILGRQRRQRGAS
ncbi:MAG: chromate transporter [Anaerolineae bacterium]